jgi:hypothetical protein
MKYGFVGFTALLALSACATTQLPPDRLASSTAAIRSADEVGAKELPQAALHLKLAQEELALAEQLAKDGDAARAELVLLRSNADADLALALARQAESQVDAEEAAAAVLAIEGKSP